MFVDNYVFKPGHLTAQCTVNLTEVVRYEC